MAAASRSVIPLAGRAARRGERVEDKRRHIERAPTVPFFNPHPRDFERAAASTNALGLHGRKLASAKRSSPALKSRSPLACRTGCEAAGSWIPAAFSGSRARTGPTAHPF
jgi:hypothetical protein